MTHTEIFSQLQGNKQNCEALVFGYGKNKTDWYKVVNVLGIHSEYTLQVLLNGKKTYIPNRNVKQVRTSS